MRKHRFLYARSYRIVHLSLLLVCAASGSVVCLTPMEELQELAKLPAEKVRLPENQEKIANLTMKITEGKQ